VKGMLARFDAKRLRAARKQKRLSQMRLAELCESSDRYIRDLERGTKENPSATLVCLMSRVLDVPMDELVKIVNEEGQRV